METTDVDNFPGYPEGINGPQMMMDLENQAKRFDTDVRSGWITKVDFSGDVHKVWVGEGDSLLKFTQDSYHFYWSICKMVGSRKRNPLKRYWRRS